MNEFALPSRSRRRPGFRARKKVAQGGRRNSWLTQRVRDIIASKYREDLMAVFAVPIWALLRVRGLQ